MFKNRNTMFVKAVSLLIIISFAAMPINSYAQIDPNTLPEGWDVQDGAATFDGSVDGVLDINQNTDNLIVNYNSFSIGADGTVNFYQPGSSSWALNRVTGGDVSQIFGTLNANGQVFIINTNGILFSPGSSVNVGGLVASSLNISNNDFLNGALNGGGFNFNCNDSCAAVINQGAINISEPGGFAALLGSRVENSGVIVANLGSVVLASGKAMTLDLDANNMVSVVINEAVTENLDNAESAVLNTGSISANGGKVLLTAKTLNGVFDNAVNNEGIIEAKSLSNISGQVYLLANGENNLVSNTGTIDVSAITSGVNGGFIEISGPRVNISGNVYASSIDAEAGTLFIDPWDLRIVDGSPTDPNVGGTVGELWLENLDGINVILQATNNINFELTTDNELNLYNFDTETFTLLAGGDINLNDDSVITNGGDIAFTSDKDFWYHTGTIPSYWINSADGIGNINLGTGSLVSNGGNIVLESGNNVNIDDANINSGGGDINITADVSFPYTEHSTDLLANGGAGNDDTSDGLGEINQNSGSVIESNGGNINMYAPEDIVLAKVDAGSGNVFITAQGAIEDGNNDGMNIIGHNLILSAGDGIGSGNAIETEVARLSARITDVSSNGNIEIDNTGDLELADVAGWGLSILNLGSGSTNIVAHSKIEITDQIVTNGDVNLTASENIVHHSNGDVYISNGDFHGYAGVDYIMEDGSSITANEGNVEIEAIRDILLGEPGEMTESVDWEYVNGNRGYHLVEIGYYYVDSHGNLVRVPFSGASGRGDIGNDGGLVSGNDAIENAVDFGFYVVMVDRDGSTPVGTFYTNPALNPDGQDHVVLNDNGTITVAWEDQYNLGDRDYDDVVINYAPTEGRDLFLGVHINTQTAEGDTHINLNAGRNIVSNHAYVNAVSNVPEEGNATINMGAEEGNISLNDSSFVADVNGDGHAEVNMDANGLDVTRTLVRAETGSGEDTAIVNMTASDNINIVDSNIEAEVFGSGVAIVALDSGRDINIDENSALSARTQDGSSSVLARAQGAIDNQGQISAISDYGYAGVGLLAMGDIYTGEISAQGEESDILAFLYDLSRHGYSFGFENYFAGSSSGILLGSLEGNITIANVTADTVIAAALGAGEGCDGECEEGGNIYNAEGDISANFAYLLARQNIGTADNMIATDVGALAGYSFDTGHVYIDQVTDRTIELGMYLPIFEIPGAPSLLNSRYYGVGSGFSESGIGLSLAANNGLIHVQSQGDIIVNSVVAPNGGVYLGSEHGSIFAGQGWDPILDPNLLGMVEEMFDMDLPPYIAHSLTDFTGIPLETLGQDYNVISGGYSYFTTPEGTIGVGTQGDTTEYNPLNVYIDAGENNSVLPPTFLLPPTSITTPGLILQIGGVVPENQLDPNNPYPGTTYNGSIGLSGAIAGIVTPGDVAITNVFPSPGVEVSDGGPAGYVFFDNKADDLASLQIWPKIPETPPANSPYLLEDKFIRVYYELTENYRIASFEPATPTDYYAYHPISATDSSSFDKIKLDANAYEFIDNNINMKDRLNPYFSGEDQKKKD